MGFKLISIALVASALSTNVHAAFIKSGSIVTDDVTGMEWLALSATTGVSYNNALSVANTNHGSGWRYAEQVEVEGLMDFFFPSYSQTHTSGDGGYEYCPEAGCYDNERRNSGFYGFFGTHRNTFVNSNGVTLQHDHGYGFVASTTRLPNLSLYGEFHLYRVTTGNNTDLHYTYKDYSTYHPDARDAQIGTYLVRDVSPVPVPAAAWLFGSGLLGLIGVARRKVRA